MSAAVNKGSNCSIKFIANWIFRAFKETVLTLLLIQTAFFKAANMEATGVPLKQNTCMVTSKGRDQWISLPSIVF